MLSTLVRDGSDEAKDRSASAIWSLATDNGMNKDTLAKLEFFDDLSSFTIGPVEVGNGFLRRQIVGKSNNTWTESAEDASASDSHASAVAVDVASWPWPRPPVVL